MRGQIVVPVLLRRGSGGKSIVPPIEAGDYIWYSYEQFLGWGINESGQNVAIDGDTVSPNFDGLVRASNVVVPNAEGVNYPIINNGDDPLTLPANSYLYYLDHATQTLKALSATGDVGDVLPISTVYNLTDSHQIVWNCMIPLTANEVAQVEADPTIMMYVYFDGLVLADGFSKADMGNFFDANGNNATIFDLSANAVDVTILGTYTEANRLHNQLQGVNTLRTIIDASGRTTDAVANNLARFNGTGQSIDTGVAIDGSLTDFTMMMAFTLPEVLDIATYLADSGGFAADNRLSISHAEDTASHNLRVQIGQFVQTISVNEAITNHAMCAVYDHTTSMLQVAVDGEPLSVAFPIVFDGATLGAVIFGARDSTGEQSFTGYLGEGILVADKLDEADWQDFWNGVKLGVTFDGGLFTNGGFENGFAGWSNQPSGSAWQATPDAETVQNSDNVAGRFLYQSFTLDAGATYEMSAVKNSGDAVITYCIDDADSGVSIEDGVHQFLGHGGLMSYGICMSVGGTGTTVCDSLRMNKVADAVVEDVTFDGEPVTFDGEQVTFTKG